MPLKPIRTTRGGETQAPSAAATYDSRPQRRLVVSGGAGAGGTHAMCEKDGSKEGQVLKYDWRRNLTEINLGSLRLNY